MPRLQYTLGNAPELHRPRKSPIANHPVRRHGLSIAARKELCSHARATPDSQVHPVPIATIMGHTHKPVHWLGGGGGVATTLSVCTAKRAAALFIGPSLPRTPPSSHGGAQRKSHDGVVQSRQLLCRCVVDVTVDVWHKNSPESSPAALPGCL